MKIFILVLLFLTSTSVFAREGVNHPGSFCHSNSSVFSLSDSRNSAVIDNSKKSSMAYIYCPIMNPEGQRIFNLNVYINTAVFTMTPSRCRVVSFDKFGKVSANSSYLNVIKPASQEVILSFKNIKVSGHGTAQVQCNVEKGSFFSISSYRTYY